jgi:outer membrane lipopolysaccharide assembly protein LptE/RlpB
MKSGIASRNIFSLALAVCSVASAGCGYHVAGRGSTLPKNIHVIAVPALENKTTAYRIEQRLTAATVHEFLSKTQYRIVSNPDSADAVLRGKVLSVEVTPLTFQQTTTTTPTGPTTPPAVTSVAQATSMLVIMTCEVTLTDRTTEKVLYHNSNFVFRNEYQLAATPNSPTTGTLSRGSVESFFQEGDPAVERMAQDFAKRLVSAVVENY